MHTVLTRADAHGVRLLLSLTWDGHREGWGEFVAVDTGWYESAIACYGFECFVDIRIWTGVRVFANFAVLKGDLYQVSGFRHRLSNFRH